MQLCNYANMTWFTFKQFLFKLFSSAHFVPSLEDQLPLTPAKAAKARADRQNCLLMGVAFRFPIHFWKSKWLKDNSKNHSHWLSEMLEVFRMPREALPQHPLAKPRKKRGLWRSLTWFASVGFISVQKGFSSMHQFHKRSTFLILVNQLWTSLTSANIRANPLPSWVDVHDDLWQTMQVLSFSPHFFHSSAVSWKNQQAWRKGRPVRWLPPRRTQSLRRWKKQRRSLHSSDKRWWCGGLSRCGDGHWKKKQSSWKG